MADELRVKIGADVKDLKKGLARALKDLDRFKSEQIKLNKSFKKGEIAADDYYDAIADNSRKLKSAQNNVRQFNNALDDTGKDAKKYGKNVKANALPATQEFSRVIQDAPFGIQGVANNLQQLTANFGSLSKATGGTIPAIKAMVSSLAGPAGVLLAVSAVTSALVTYGDEIKALISPLGQQARVQRELAQATSEYIGSARSEITVLNSLLNIARDENNSKRQRQRAIDQINDKYSKYLGNLDLESVKTDKVTKSVNKLSEALLGEARVRGAESVLEEKSKELAEETAEIIEESGEAARLAAGERIKENRKKIKVQEDLIDLLEAEKDAGKDTSAAIEDATRKIAELKKEASLEDRDLIADGILSDRIKEETADSVREIKLFQKALEFALKESFKGLNLDDDGDVQRELDKRPPLEVPITLKPVTDLPDGEITAPEIPTISTAIDSVIEKQNQLLENSKLIAQGVGDAFNTLGTNIANALTQTQGVFGAFVGTLIQQSLKLVSQLIQNSIKTAAVTKAQAAQQIATNKAVALSEGVKGAAQSASGLGPAAAFVLPALIAGAVAAISGAFSGIGGGGSSGSASSGVSGAGGSNFSGTNISTTGPIGGGGRVVFEIAGDKLIGVLNNSLSANQQIGDTVGVG